MRVAVAGLAPTLTGLVEAKLKVGRLRAPTGLPVMAAVSATLPVKPPLGVTRMMAVFPVVDPAATVMFAPVTAKLGAAPVTVTEAVV
jgi:hypothetical protein